jgi:hypothetical protein
MKKRKERFFWLQILVILACVKMKYFFDPFWLFLTRFGLSDIFWGIKDWFKDYGGLLLVKF